jgi:nitrite reductase (NO-forming)
MVGGLIAGPPLVATGLVLSMPALTAVGAVATAVGAAGQLVYAWTVWRRRATWTTDAPWHRLTAGHLSAGMTWFLFACVLAAFDILDDGLAPTWSLGALGMPLLGGWVIQILVGAWSYLLPSVAGRGHEVRAGQRALLGRWATARLAGWNAGILLAWAGLSAGNLAVALAGIALFTAAALASAGLLFAALMLRQPSGSTEREPRGAT